MHRLLERDTSLHSHDLTIFHFPFFQRHVRGVCSLEALVNAILELFGCYLRLQKLCAAFQDLICTSEANVAMGAEFYSSNNEHIA